MCLPTELYGIQLYPQLSDSELVSETDEFYKSQSKTHSKSPFLFIRSIIGKIEHQTLPQAVKLQKHWNHWQIDVHSPSRCEGISWIIPIWNKPLICLFSWSWVTNKPFTSIKFASSTVNCSHLSSVQNPGWWLVRGLYYPLYIGIIEGSLEVKLPTIWTDEKQSREEAERRERLEERRVEEKE